LYIFILAFGLINLYRKSARSQALLVTQYIFALLGIYFAARQIWLMSLPTGEIPACLPGLSVLIHYFPWHETVRALVWGSGNCTEIRWTWLGLSIPTWSIVYFVCVAIATAIAYFKPKEDPTSN
jgi:disulfide bond formation protein DsbB